MDDFKELEYKYDASEIPLTSFLNMVSRLHPVKRQDVSSWDYYYTLASAEKPEEFIRYRDSQRPELTIKRKTKQSNNWERVEIDLPLDPARTDENTVKSFVNLLNYKENFRIYKSCFIFWFNDVNMVYYIVYDDNMKEKGRFIEIEVNKEKVKQLADPFATLKLYEASLLEVGIKPSNRLKRSLYEMFVK
jgi:adenylate cyclase class IV